MAHIAHKISKHAIGRIYCHAQSHSRNHYICRGVPCGRHSNASNSGDKNDIPTKKLGDVIGAYKSLTTVAFVQGVKTLKWPPFSENCGNEIITNTSLETTKTFLAFNNTLPIIRHGGTKTLIIYKKLLNLPPSFGEF